MTPLGLLAEARAAGVTVTADDCGGLDAEYAGDRPAELLGRLKAHKRAVLAVLRGEAPQLCVGCSVGLTGGLLGCRWADCPKRDETEARQ
jgi:hypothetical protein